jgi:RNA-splicing ligase RtcB
MEIIAGARLPMYSWAVEIEPDALRQARNLGDLEIAVDHAALMPDAHLGFGMPIGGVLFAADAVVPYAIGVDIGCGVQIARTNLVWEDTLTPAKLRAILRQIQRDVPTGFAVHRRAPMGMDRMLELVGMAAPASIAPRWLDRALLSIGTLGGGNHFLEVQRDDDDGVFFMLHSGSRNLGKQICDMFAKRALTIDHRAGRELPDRELAYLRFDEDEDAEHYWDAMTFALRWAELNRRQMMDVVEAAFRKHASVHRFERLVDILTTTPRVRSMPACRASSTARAPYEPVSATPFSFQARWARRPTSGKGSATAMRSKLASTAPVGYLAGTPPASEEGSTGFRRDGHLGHRVHQQ